MGSFSSKATRTLPKRVTTPPWSGARVPRPADSVAEAASETKNDAIEQDPQFLSKLSQLGPVRVDHHMYAVRPAAQTNHMFNSRVQSENEAAAPTQTLNRVQAPTLSRLLDERKSIRTRRDMEFLAQRFGLEVEKLDAIAKFLSTPSVHQNSAVRVTGESGDEKQIMKAVWVEPRLKDASV
ncbi:hypothetical protein DFH07DRAFT_840984 [Mycena maculata]|uniref:Uncharacterized protein n=1 Tax=Mycena maculata TaxID=230809 RepID=A0AAD7IAA1_9AGAR|nr:hypothetical protein DFH07DRAFT_840984 [Mycena maculata]